MEEWGKMVGNGDDINTRDAFFVAAFDILEQSAARNGAFGGSAIWFLTLQKARRAAPRGPRGGGRLALSRLSPAPWLDHTRKRALFMIIIPHPSTSFAHPPKTRTSPRTGRS